MIFFKYLSVVFLMTMLLISVLSFSLDVDFSETHLGEALSYISSLEKVVFVYPSEIEKVRVNLKIQKVDLETLLRLLLLPLGLDYENIAEGTYVIFSKDSIYSTPRYVSTYEPNYLDPRIISKFLDNINIENHVLGNRNVYYARTKEQISHVSNLISKLDNQKSISQSALVIRVTYILSDEVRMSQNISLESFLLSNVQGVQKHFSNKIYYFYLPFSLKYKLSDGDNTDISSLKDEEILGSYMIENDYGSFLSEVVWKSDNIFVRFKNESEYVDLPLYKVREYGEKKQNSAILKFGNSIAIVETYLVEFSNLKQQDSGNFSLSRTKNILDNRRFTNSFELMYIEPKVAIALSNGKNKFSAIFDTSNSTATNIVEQVDFLSNIFEESYIGFGYNFSVNSFTLILEDFIEFWNFKLQPIIQYVIKLNSFSVSLNGELNFSAGNFMAGLSALMKYDSISNTSKMSYGAFIGMNQSFAEYKLGIVFSENSLGFHGSLKW
ncbi:hypothetical protein [Fervidobacterium sp.]